MNKETAKEIAEKAFLYGKSYCDDDDATMRDLGEIESWIIEYAKTKCKEQREICAKYGGGVNNWDDITNARTPNFK